MKIIRSITEHRYLPVAAVALALTAATALAQPTPPLLVLTEVSDTVLTAAIGGAPVGTVTEVAPNHWTWDSGFALSTAPVKLAWMEPTGETGLNIVTEETLPPSVAGVPGHFGLDIMSDAPRQDITVIKNQGTGSLFVGPNEVELQVEFDDKGDSSTVPDVSSTLGLLAAAIGSCFALARFKQVRA